MYSQNSHLNYQLKIWLFLLIGLVILIILVGGLTRLTDSGLSITTWELFVGFIPPLTNEKWINYLDFRHYNEYLKDVKTFNPDFLFHLGAHTDLEYCEKNIEDTYLTNTIAVENATYISNLLNIPLLYISTAGIFDGKKELYDDWDIPNPLGIYARSKYLGEKFVVNNAKKYFIFRAGWMMGGGPQKDKKFINKIFKQINSGAKNLNIINDKFGTPTYTIDFAKNTKLVLEQQFYGLYNLVCDGLTDRLEVTKELLKIIKKDKEIIINEVDSDFYKKDYFAPRPECERLINKKLILRKLNNMRNWKICLKEYIEKNFL